MNGASDFIVQVMEETGVHVRPTVGVAQLPMDVRSKLKRCSNSIVKLNFREGI